MTTYEDLIEEARHSLMTAQPDRINVLDASINDSTTSLVLTHANKGVAEGSRLAIGLEEMHVISVSGGGATTNVTVVRGMGGSTKAAHTAGDLVYVNPQFSNWRISKYINQGLDNISAEGLFQVKNVTLTASATAYGYEVTGTSGLIDIYKVRHDTVGPSNHWPHLRPDEYIFDQAANVTDFPSGMSLTLRTGVETARPITVSYRAGYEHLVNLDDDVLAVSGLHDEAHDLPSMWAALRLLAGREIKRSFLNAQPEPRRQEEVPPGHANQAMRPLLEQYFDRIKTETKRLRRRYPGTH